MWWREEGDTVCENHMEWGTNDGCGLNEMRREENHEHGGERWRERRNKCVQAYLEEELAQLTWHGNYDIGSNFLYGKQVELKGVDDELYMKAVWQ